MMNINAQKIFTGGAGVGLMINRSNTNLDWNLLFCHASGRGVLAWTVLTLFNFYSLFVKLSLKGRLEAQVCDHAKFVSRN